MKKTRITALLLAVLLVLSLFSACGKQETAENGSSAATPSKTESVASESGGTSSEEKPTGGDSLLPICEEKTTVTLFTTMDSNLTGIVNDFNETPFFQELEKRTNVHVEFEIPASGNEQTAFNLLFASGELPDMIRGTGTGYPGGLDAGVDDGYFLDLTDLIPQYAPNYWKALNEWNERDTLALQTSYTGKGRMVALGQIPVTTQGPWAGYYMRKDWLDACGLDIPVTYGDWETVLTAFKDQMGATAPMLLYKLGYDPNNNTLSVGYGVTCSFFQENGAVKYGPAEEGWKKYVTLMRDWYSKGLIDPDFMSSTAGAAFLPDEAMVTTGKTGVVNAMYTNVAKYEAAIADANAEFVPVYPPMEKAGDVNNFLNLNLSRATADRGLTISATSENVETCLRLIDYFYTDEGFLLCNYGIEGETFDYDKDGNPFFNETVTANDTMSFAQAQAYYTMPPAKTVLYDWRRELASVPEKDRVSFDVWGAASGSTSDKTLPSIGNMGMDPDLYTEYSTIMADITTVVDESTAQFISGALSLDEYDSYLEKLNKMNLDRAIALVQEAYDNFMN